MARNVYHMDNTYIRQHTYLLYNTHMGEKFRVREYIRCLKHLNNYLPMLPVEDGTPAITYRGAVARNGGAHLPKTLGQTSVGA